MVFLYIKKAPVIGAFFKSLLILLGWYLVVTVRAVNLRTEHFFGMRDLGNVGVTVVAGPHIVVFYDETTIGRVNLRPVRVLGWSPFRIGMAFQAGFVVTQILGNDGAGKTQGRYSQDNCNE